MEEDDRIRMSQIHQMLLEIGSGTFTHRISRSNRNDALEAIVVLMNMMAEELQQRFLTLQLPQPAAVQNLRFLALMLGEAFRVRSFAGSALEYLHLPPQSLIGMDVSSLLEPSSEKRWQKSLARPGAGSRFPISCLLHFRCRNGNDLPLHCTLYQLEATEGMQPTYLLTGYGSPLEPEGSEFQRNPAGGLERAKNARPTVLQDFDPSFKKHDRQTIEDIHAYILQHLDKPLPNLKSLAHQFGTNEFKLKYGFKKIYGITVFRFLLRERLRRAALLLRNTEIPLKKIAALTGFKSYPHFSRAFKRRYKQGPRQYRNQHPSPAYRSPIPGSGAPDT